MTDVQTAVDRLADELGQPVLVEDPRHQPLWWSAQGKADPTRIRTILQRDVTPAAAALVARLRLAEAEGPVRTPADPRAEMLERWCVPLRVGRDLVGYLWVVDAEGKVTEADLPRLQATADIAAVTLARTRPSRAAVDRHRASLLARLAAGPDEDAAHDLIAGDDLDPAATVVVNAPLAAGGWVIRGGMSVHVDPKPGARATSGPPLPLLHLSVAVHRAASTLQALRAGARLAAPTWSALGSWQLIVAAAPDVTPADIHRGAEILSKQRRSDLLVTARALLENGGDVTLTAAELHVHRTTLYYRLERIESLTGVHLKAGAAAHDDLLMALRLAAFRDAAD
ncbi:MAG TPA: helix-turn-helix domain-containing protein [Jatrophihabitans sp.]|nr:helix-turn-helix domain-containing protein [Jatrophihabitans sp.]